MTKEKHICEFCRNSFSTKSILRTHKETALYCLTKRGVTCKVQKYECKYCKKKYTAQQNLNKHLKICEGKWKYHAQKIKSRNFSLRKENKKLQKESSTNKSEITKLKEQKEKSEKDIYELKELIKELKEENIITREKLAEKKGEINGIINAPVRNITTNTTKNKNTTYVNPKLVNINIDNIKPFTDKLVKKHVANGEFTDKFFEKGIDGIAKFVVPIMTFIRDDGIIERNYVCTDISRNKFYRLDENKVWKSDSGGLYIGKMIKELGPSVNKSYQKLVDKKHSTDSDHMKNVYKEKIDKLMPIYRASVHNFHEEFVDVLSRTKNTIKHQIAV